MAELAEHFETTTTVASEEENGLIDEVVGYEEQDWRRIPGTVQEPVEYFQVLAKPTSVFGKNKSKNKSSAGADSDKTMEGAWGKAITTVDTSAVCCLAYFWHFMGNSGNARFEKKNGRLLKMQVDVPDSHTTFIVTSAKMPFPGVDNRIFPARWAWRREQSGDFVAGFTYKGSNEYVERVIKEDERAQQVVKSCQRLEAASADVFWSPLQSPSALVGMWSKPPESFEKGERKISLGKAECDVDVAAKDAQAWWFAFCSRDRMRINEEEGNPARLNVREVANENVVAAVKNMPRPFRRREFVAIQVCASDDNNDDLLFAGESVDEIVDYGKNFKTVRGTVRLFARLRVVTPNTCKLTAFQFFDAGGRVPAWVLNMKVTVALSGVEDIRQAFDRSDEVDKMNRDELAGVIEPGIVRATVTTLEKFERLDPLCAIPQTRITWTQQPDMGGLIPSKAVRGAAVGQMKYLSKMCKRFDKSPAIDVASNLRLVTMIQNHDGDYSERELEILEEGRKMLGVFEQQESKELEMTSRTTEAKMAFEDGSSHAYGWSLAVVRASPVQVLAHVLDVKKRAGVRADHLEKTLDEDGEHNKLLYLKKKVPNPFDDRDFLSRIVWRKRATGYIFVSVPELSNARPLSSDVVRARLPSMLKMTSMNDGSTKLEPAGDSKAKLCNMSAKQANIIGGALASCIAANLTAPAAVDEWILRYPAMGELEREYVWFRPMMDTIAQRLLESVGWGLKMRLYTGAALSTMDLISDVFMIYTCFELVCESIPGSVLQLAALVREASKDDGKFSKVALGSIIVSACTTGFTAATISFDFDVAPQRRRDEPDFYGYVPDSAGKRTAIFFCMIMNGALLLLLRSLSTALLLMVEVRFVLYYYLGDHAFYLAFKLQR
ncbi:hypothetical protein TeGR_g3140 [Tetraparma gracilis]|uniref:Uncharacterized protein n=1 Tax=Tetraparma gracilis TaxID=2962635 RepID=A0ABQ6MEY2_9STRA|nr:hypothetical protein TeGR_g3140 [Tetraparma gracilis]